MNIYLKKITKFKLEFKSERVFLMVKFIFGGEIEITFSF